MKKLVVLACALALAMGLAACSSGTSSSAASSASASSAASSAAASSASASSAAASSGAAASSSAAANANLTDFEWIAFEMPNGWIDAKESDSYVAIREEANNNHVMKISRRTLLSSTPTAAELAESEAAKDASRYTAAGSKTVGDREWHLVEFTFNGNPSVKAFTNLTDKKAMEVTIFEMPFDDPAVQTVLSTFVVDESKL